MNDYFSQRRALIDGYLGSLDQLPMPQSLREPFEAATRSRGKRVRGTLLIAVGEAFGSKADSLVGAAAGLELIHTSSLILDDLPAMDDAEMRRGELTLHRRFGEDLAVLTAVALLNQAYGLIGISHQSLEPRRWPLHTILDRVVDAVGLDGSIGGEAVDLHSESESLDFQTLEYIHSRKTGALFVAAAAVGAMLANAAPAALRALEAYAKNLGLAFQITDDILDVIGTREGLGKDVGKDSGKLTFVRLAGLEGARKLVDELIETSVASIVPLGSRGDRLRELAIVVQRRSS